MALYNKMTSSVDAAEKEASEVLHSLLSVERVVAKQQRPHQNIIITTIQQDQQIESDNLQWQGNVAIAAHPLFSEHFSQTIDEQQVHDVVWQGHTIQVETNENGDINLYTTEAPVTEELKTIELVKEDQVVEQKEEEIPRKEVKTKSKKLRKIKPKAKRDEDEDSEDKKNWDPTKLEENPAQVKDRFKRGCECQDESCFRGLSAESVYKHRLNIAELTKGEHDMYLMGVTMACLANPDTTVRHKERQRLRAQYVYQGRRVCLDAFLYLENCTHYQLKRIRKHVMTHGVAPRIHGNHGKKPHNTFSLDIYQHATQFLKSFLETHNIHSTSSLKSPILLPYDITRKNLHNSYKEYGQLLAPGLKLMGYSTFRHFLKEQFPNVRFCKVEPKSQHQHPPAQVEQQAQQTQTAQQGVIVKSNNFENKLQQVIPLVVNQTDIDVAISPNQSGAATFLVAPVSQLINSNNNLINMQSPQTQNNNFPYQVANSYLINNQGNIINTNSNYTFNRI